MPYDAHAERRLVAAVLTNAGIGGFASTVTAEEFYVPELSRAFGAATQLLSVPVQRRLDAVSQATHIPRRELERILSDCGPCESERPAATVRACARRRRVMALAADAHGIAGNTEPGDPGGASAHDVARRTAEVADLRKIAVALLAEVDALDAELPALPEPPPIPALATIGAMRKRR